MEYHKDRFWVLFFFTIYLLSLGAIIRKHGLKFHMYADDCQLYTSFSMSTNEAVSSMQMAIDDIRAWYAANMLKLNDDKIWNAGNWFKIAYYPKTSWFECGIHGYYTWRAC